MSRYPTPPPRRQHFERPVSRPTLHPRRVVGGIRLVNRPPIASVGTGGLPSVAEPGDALPGEEAAHATPAEATGWTWASARWMRPVERLAPGDQLAEGLEYARAGQTRSLDMRPGIVSARVQGRMPQAYRASVRLPTFTPEQWEKVTTGMAAQAKYAAAILAGELPTNIEDMFAPAGLSLFPTNASDLSCSCECDVFTGKPHDFGPGDTTAPAPVGASPESGPSKRRPARAGIPWCKHICCLMFLVADRLGTSPMTVFNLRGLPEQDLLERLRQARALAGMQRSGGGAVPVYTAHVPGITPAAPLEESIANFWNADEPDALEALDMPIAPPEVSHPLLRRVGPSPFTGAKFPITGLLATCYDVISEAVIREAESGAPEPAQADSAAESH